MESKSVYLFGGELCLVVGRMLCFVQINSVILNLLCVFVLEC